MPHSHNNTFIHIQHICKYNAIMHVRQVTYIRICLSSYNFLILSLIGYIPHNSFILHKWPLLSIYAQLSLRIIFCGGSLSSSVSDLFLVEALCPAQSPHLHVFFTFLTTLFILSYHIKWLAHIGANPHNSLQHMLLFITIYKWRINRSYTKNILKVY